VRDGTGLLQEGPPRAPWRIGNGHVHFIPGWMRGARLLVLLHAECAGLVHHVRGLHVHACWGPHRASMRRHLIRRSGEEALVRCFASDQLQETTGLGSG
jgi:hypothetical protein